MRAGVVGRGARVRVGVVGTRLAGAETVGEGVMAVGTADTGAGAGGGAADAGSTNTKVLVKLK